MGVYILRADSRRYRSLLCAEGQDSKVLPGQFRRLPVARPWVPVKVELCPDDPPVANLSDFPLLTSSVPVFSRRAVEALGSVLEGHGEILPLECAEGEYFAYNVTTVIDALDEERSEVKRFSDGGIMRIIRHEFFSERVAEAMIFKLPEDHGPDDVFVTDAFVEMVGDLGLTGFEFEKVWPNAPAAPGRARQPPAGPTRRARAQAARPGGAPRGSRRRARPREVRLAWGQPGRTRHIYLLFSDFDRSKPMEPLDPEDRLIFEYLDGRPVAEFWTPVPVRVVWDDPEMGREASGSGDLLTVATPAPERATDDVIPYVVSSHVPVFSRRAVDCLRELLLSCGELLPLSCPDGEYFAFNLTRVIDALDHERSEIEYLPAGQMRIVRREFYVERITGPIFRLPWRGNSPPYVTDRFVEEVERCGLTGFEFYEVWADAAEGEGTERPGDGAPEGKPVPSAPSSRRLGRNLERAGFAR